MNYFITEVQIFFDKGLFTPKNPNFGGFQHNSTAHATGWPLGLQRIRALHLTVERPRVFPVTFLYNLLFSRHRRAFPLISRTSQNFSCHYSVSSLDTDFIFGSSVGLIEALPTVT